MAPKLSLLARESADVVDLVSPETPKRQVAPPSSPVEKGLGSPTGVLPKRSKKRRFEETTQLSPPKPMRTQFGEEDFRTPIRNRTQALNSPSDPPLNPPPDQRTPDTTETVKNLVTDLKGLELEDPRPLSILSQRLGQRESPDMSLSVRAHRSSPTSLSGLHDFVGGPIHFDLTPDHSKFRRMRARDFDDRLEDDAEIENQK